MENNGNKKGKSIALRLIIEGYNKEAKCMAMFSDATLPAPDPFTGCDGKPLSDQFLRDRIQSLCEEERYEEAARDRDELLRREEERKK